VTAKYGEGMSRKYPMSPGASFSEVAPRKDFGQKAPDPAEMTLEAELYEALELACHGQPMTPKLAGDLKMAVMTVLHRRGIRPGRIDVRRSGGSFTVDLQLPPSVPKVRHIQINVGGNSWTGR
jgi:hypothetical protein